MINSSPAFAFRHQYLYGVTTESRSLSTGFTHALPLSGRNSVKALEGTSPSNLSRNQATVVIWSTV